MESSPASHARRGGGSPDVSRVTAAASILSSADGSGGANVASASLAVFALATRSARSAAASASWISDSSIPASSCRGARSGGSVRAAAFACLSACPPAAVTETH